jgi:preprotein translocase subunit Sss1
MSLHDKILIILGVILTLGALGFIIYQQNNTLLFSL